MADDVPNRPICSTPAEREAEVEDGRGLSVMGMIPADNPPRTTLWKRHASVTDADTCVRIRRNKHHGDAHALRAAEGIPLSVRSRKKVIS